MRIIFGALAKQCGGAIQFCSSVWQVQFDVPSVLAYSRNPERLGRTGVSGGIEKIRIYRVIAGYDETCGPDNSGSRELNQFQSWRFQLQWLGVNAVHRETADKTGTRNIHLGRGFKYDGLTVIGRLKVCHRHEAVSVCRGGV